MLRKLLSLIKPSKQPSYWASEIILLNQLAQNIVPLSKGIEWFAREVPTHQLEILLELGAITQQAHPTMDDVASAAKLFGVKLTYTPAVLFSKDRFQLQLPKVLALPPNEYEKSFRLLLGLLSIADGRRRMTVRKDGCTHWWHRDLADEKVVENLLRSNLS